MKNIQPHNEELQRFQAEAAELLGLPHPEENQTPAEDEHTPEAPQKPSTQRRELTAKS